MTEVQLIRRHETQASSYQKPNYPENTLDYDFNTRVAYFDIEVSKDGHSWTPVYSGSSSGTQGGLERLEHYTFDPVIARYVRIVGHGNSSNNWISISEVEIINEH